MKNINFEDFIQVCTGSAILAIPIAFTEESWKLSESIPQFKLILIVLTSILFNGIFIFYGIYEGNIKNKVFKYTSRIVINYGLTLITVTYILYLLNILNVNSQFFPLLSKIILVSFPASLSGAVIDSFDKE